MKSLITFFIACGGLLFLALCAYILFRRGWKIPRPDEVLVIVSRGGRNAVVDASQIGDDVVEATKERRDDGSGFRISRGATWVNPVTSKVFRLPIDSRKTTYDISCYDSNKIPVTVGGVILYKVGDSNEAIKAAAKRFQNTDPGSLNDSVEGLVSGQIRALVGEMTIAQLINDRQSLIDNVREQILTDMARLGLQVDALMIQDIVDPNGFIENLGRPEAERVAREASIAADNARLEREEVTQRTALGIAEAQRNTQVQAAAFQAEQDEAKAKAEQAGPLAKAQAEVDVVAQETIVAERRAAMTEKLLDADVRKAADADRYATEQRAEANRRKTVLEAEAEAERVAKVAQAEADSRRVRGEAEADITLKVATAEAEGTKAKGTAEADIVAARGSAEANVARQLAQAEADGFKAKGEALTGEAGENIIQQKLTDKMPQIVRAASEPFAAIDNIVVSDPESLGDAVVTGIAAAGKAISTARGVSKDKDVQERLSKMTGIGQEEPVGIPAGGKVEVATEFPTVVANMPVMTDAELKAVDLSDVETSSIPSAADVIKKYQAADAAEKSKAAAEKAAKGASDQVERSTVAEPANAKGHDLSANAQAGVDLILNELGNANSGVELLGALKGLKGNDPETDRVLEAGVNYLKQNPDALKGVLAETGMTGDKAVKLVSTVLKRLS